MLALLLRACSHEAVSIDHKAPNPHRVALDFFLFCLFVKVVNVSPLNHFAKRLKHKSFTTYVNLI